jgi:predicted transcriptional regulator of viral defense system
LLSRRSGCARAVGESRVQVVNQAESKFFGFERVDVLGYKVMISDREKTAIDCIDHPPLAGGVGGAATIVATASRRFDWNKAADSSNGSAPARWCAASAGWPTTSRRIFRPPCASAGAGWRLGAAPEHRVPGAIGYDETWRLFVNVSREELHGSAGLGQRKTTRKGA